jgi:hypothetical protein
LSTQVGKKKCLASGTATEMDYLTLAMCVRNHGIIEIALHITAFIVLGYWHFKIKGLLDISMFEHFHGKSFYSEN